MVSIRTGPCRPPDAMEDPVTGARGLEDHGSTVLHLSGGGGGAVVSTPEPGGGLLAGDGEEVCGALEVRLFALAEGADFAVGLVNPLEAVSSSLEGRMPEAGEAKGSSLEERPMSMEEEKGGSLSFVAQDSAEPGSLRMCHVANGGLSDKEVHVLSGEACRFKDVRCVYGTLDKVTGGSPCELDDLVGNSCGVAEVKTCIGYIDMASEETNHCNVGSSDSMKPSSEQWPHGVDGLETITYANNEPQQDDLAPNIEAEVLNADSVSSLSGSTGVSVGETVQFLQRSDNPVTSHVADGSLWNNNCFCDPARCMHDMVDMATKGNPCKQNSLAGEGVFSAGVDAKTSLHNLEMHCKEPHDDNKGQPDLVKIGIERLPHGMAVTCLKKNAARNLEKYGLLPKSVAEDSVIMHENSVPSVSGSSIAVSLDGMPGHIGDSSENRAMMENVASGSQGGGKLLLESQFCSREVNTSEEGMGTGWTKASHDTGDMSDLGEHHTEELPSGNDGLTLITGANQEMERILPNIDPVGSCPVDEDSVLSIYGSSIDVRLDGRDDLMGCVSERSSNVDKPTCSSPGGEMLLCESGLQSKAYGYEKNQESSMEAFNRLNVSVCKSSMEELKSCGPSSVNGIQQISQKYGIPESSLERDLHSSYKLQQQCDEEPCFSGRESSALCLGRQDPGVGRSGSLDLNACNSADDKAGSVDFVTNGNDTESQSQQLSTMLVFRRKNPKRAASSRNLHSEKPDQINKASSGSSRPKKVEPPKSLYQSITYTIPNKITRGRRDLNRPHKSSVWGNLEKLMGDFSQSYGPLTPNSHPTSLENGSSSKRSDQINLSNIRKCRSSRSSRSRCSTLSDAVHLTNELNEQPAFSAIADSVYLESRREVIPKVASYTPEFTDSTNTHHLKRDFVSSTQEICSAEIHGECAKLSTSGPPLKNDNGTVMLPVGFSPDSVLEVASITCESNASASHDVILHENSLAGVLNGGGHHSAFLPTSYLGRNQTPSLMQLEQQAKTAGVSENMKSEQTDLSHTMMNNDAGKGDLKNLQKSKTVRKSSIVRKKGSNKKEGTTGKRLKSRSSTQISPCEASKPRAFSNDAILPDSSELLVHTGYPELDSCFELQTSPLQDHGNAKSQSVTENGKESAFHTIKSPKHKRKDANAGKKGKVRNSHTKGKSKKKNIADGTSLDRGLFNLHSTSLATSHTKEQSDLSPTELAFKNSGTMSTDLPGNIVCKADDASVPAAAAPPPPPPRAAWVCCDDCQKWRCIPAELADVIGETNCRWTCKDNGDKALADCSIPQEKSNAEINAELDLSDVSADEADGDGSNPKACRAPSWTHVRLNLFLHRNRRTQSIDESMVCNCKPPQDGRMGCGDGCLNRMLNIECVKRTCPCGEQCSNHQFQRRNYAKLRWFYSGNKGFGLQLQEDVSEGRFLIEYVGEVLDIASYESRQQYYASKGQKHFYFMALNGGEVIDACTKGNLGRFINHSCSPNCRTEKWMVNGEVCIGIFAMRNIKKGEELTFDYNYVRVSGAAPQKCFCGTAKCRGYIGGDITIVDTINQDGTEAGHFEHTVIHKDSEESTGANGSGSHGSHPYITESEFSTQDEDLHDSPAANAELEPLKQTGGTLLDTSEPENSLDTWCSQEDEDVVRTPVHVSRTFESSLQHFSVHDIQSSDSLRQTPCTAEMVKDPNVVNGPPPGFEGNLVPGSIANKRNKLKHHRNVKQSSPIDNGHILGVEGRLNNLLDRNGGISKRKDATNGYLKLLCLTAAEGDSYGGTSKSVRDLSLILDALLKTKSRAVLLDIINKNGLQMLHNILKQNRSNFHRIPILRKLLKVLEFLALEEILTYEHINGGPRCAGVESFRDSMMRLTRHNDIQVHQIARNFRDRWIPRNIARSETTEYPHASTSAHGFRGNNIVWNSTRRKRKSRWDYQPEEHYKMVGLKFQKTYHEHGSFDVIGLMRNKVQGYQGANKYQNDVHGIVNSTESTDDEVPPGFESHQEHRPVQALDCKVAPGLCMGRYQPILTISYGIPITLVQHIGTPEAEGQCHQKWKVAPGVPFNPFPPLPPYPRGSPCPSTSSQISPNMKHNSSGHYGRTTTDRDGRVHRTWRNGPRTRWPHSNHRRGFPSNHQRFERSQPSRPQ